MSCNPEPPEVRPGGRILDNIADFRPATSLACSIC